MAIRNVNGRNVYVLEPQSPTAGGKTTTGRNWATLYTDLRWKVWEETQKNEARMMKMELASADQRRDYYDDKIKVLQDQRKQLQSAALRAQGGNTSSANSLALRAAQGLERQKRQQAGQVVTTEKPGKDIFGAVDPSLPREVVTRTTAPVGGVDPRATQVYESIVDSFISGELTEAEAAEAAKAAGVPAPQAGAALSIDQQIDQLDRDLDVLLRQRQQAAGGVDLDLQTRTRRAFEADQGVIGRGGTAFGLAPRRRRTRARVDQPLAQERVGAFAEAAVQDRAERQALQQTKRDLMARRDELAFLIEPTEGQDEGEMLRNQALIQSFDDQLSVIDDRLSQPSITERALSAEEFTPRGAGELLLRDRPTRRRAAPPVGTVTTGEMEIEQAPTSAPEPAGSMEDLGLAPKSPEDLEAARRAVEAAGASVGPKPEGELPPIPVERRPLPELDRATMPTPVPAAGEPVAPLPVGQPVVLDKEQAMADPNILDNPDFVPSRDLLAEARNFYRGMTIQRKGDKRPRKILAPSKYFGGDTEMVKEYLRDQIREAAPVGEDIQEEIEAVDKPQASSTRQRKDKYKFQVITEGAKLAAKPKRLQRIAKTEADDENRPEHFVIVDKLFATNKGKSDLFKLTYDEISRVYAEKPDQRKEAHSYLVAKDILESNIEEPLA
jgi:hypothetical protein